jgi:hypothetical protein
MTLDLPLADDAREQLIEYSNFPNCQRTLDPTHATITLSGNLQGEAHPEKGWMNMLPRAKEKQDRNNMARAQIPARPWAEAS